MHVQRESSVKPSVASQSVGPNVQNEVKVGWKVISFFRTFSSRCFHKTKLVALRMVTPWQKVIQVLIRSRTSNLQILLINIAKGFCYPQKMKGCKMTLAHVSDYDTDTITSSPLKRGASGDK